MSMFFGQKPQISSEQKIAQAEAEIDMVSDMYSRLVKSCTAKCIDTSYREADLNKGESVCLDRCVSKFFEVNVKVSEKMQGEAQGKQGGGGGVKTGGMRWCVGLYLDASEGDGSDFQAHLTSGLRIVVMEMVTVIV
ncbi:hypothetical protein PTNB73_10025 [Pyrenophora teres f. teres]|nr:hypothetical protein HRS9139_09836 [Pyrenophora teres f. teres]CAA9966867.1 Mitochondrial import inner membrane translocase protein [Pyrenophora teres f. maculata]KAE8823641.1 hypothetical protein PTNB85_10143 [Pyrenophora teres f. teres]KAE8833974.1 hypothetical protein HRS9122_08054 [Pyrenophora teres f. teres]KAE8854602.1 hypothetical protein PTNB29_09958 [Pyrenophora teres f. teres]